jgi:hypothetical protein
MASVVVLPWWAREVGVPHFIGDRRLQGRFGSQPRRHGRRMGEVRRRHGAGYGDYPSGRAAKGGVARLLGVRRVEQGIGPGRRFGEGDPTAHGPAGGSLPWRPGPAELRRSDARRRRGRALWRPGTKLFRSADFDRVFLKFWKQKLARCSIKVVDMTLYNFYKGHLGF